MDDESEYDVVNTFRACAFENLRMKVISPLGDFSHGMVDAPGSERDGTRPRVHEFTSSRVDLRTCLHGHEMLRIHPDPQHETPPSRHGIRSWDRDGPDRAGWGHPFSFFALNRSQSPSIAFMPRVADGERARRSTIAPTWIEFPTFNVCSNLKIENLFRRNSFLGTAPRCARTNLM